MTHFLPFERMQERLAIAEENSIDDYFNNLMFFGEMICKFTVAGFIAGIEEGRDRHQYRLRHRLVHTDGIGEWANTLNEILTGVPAQTLSNQLQEEAKQLTERVNSEDWRYTAVDLIRRSNRLVDPSLEALPRKVTLRIWFTDFATLRNNTRGHGAPLSSTIGKVVPHLAESLKRVSTQLLIFARGWAYLAPTQRGKYRVTKWTPQAENLSFLKTRQGIDLNLEEGTYLYLGNGNDAQSVKKVDLVLSNIDATDFHLPNGGFRAAQYEVLSYITNSKMRVDAKNYLQPVSGLPESETQGFQTLYQGRTTSNLPKLQGDYIIREKPELRLYDELVQDNQHRIITLIGRGGIGKTWLALKVLDKISNEGKFDVILWFSARDVDLLADGAKQVRPHVLNEKDIAEEFAKLVGPYILSHDELNSDSFDRVEFLRKNLREFSFGSILFVFDNFETVNSPIELYFWIDQYLRLPNRALITTRYREFKGDYPIELTGMNFEETSKLIDQAAERLSIRHLVTPDYKQEIFEDSEGHPYIVRILLGEIKKADKRIKFERVIATQDGILEALFERTYQRLSPAAKRVFLTLCSWKSLVPQVALEAILLQHDIAVEKAIEDLLNSSLIERIENPGDDTVFLSVPLVARKFGERKLSVSPMKISIDTDVDLLRYFGPSQASDVRHGLEPRIRSLMRNIRQQIHSSRKQLYDFMPLLRLVASQYPPMWIQTADLLEDFGKIEEASDALRGFIEYSNDNAAKKSTWERLSRLYAAHGRLTDELQARLELVEYADIDYSEISNTANKFNSVLSLARDSNDFQIGENEKRQIAQTLISLMEERAGEATATDFSRLGWLYIHIGEKEKAARAADRGLELDENNDYCLKLRKSIWW